MSLNGLNPLAIAIQNGHLTIVQYMLDFCEVDVNKTLNDLISPLHLAAAIGHLELVQCLLSHKADMDKARFDGATPLFMAAAGGFPTVVDYLLQKGANVHKAARHNNKDGVTLLDIAIQNGQSGGVREKEYLQVIKSLNDHILLEQQIAAAAAEPLTKRPRLRR